MGWPQGEHVALVGSTGTGKTTLLEALAARRKYIVILLTKQDTLAWRKFTRISQAKQMDTAKAAADGSVRLLLRPSAKERAEQFRQAILKAYRQGGWSVGFDEIYEMQLLGLEPEIIQLYSEGRSERVSCLGGMQRPSWVTRKGVSRWALSQPTHTFSFQVRDDRDLKIMEEIYGKSYARIVRDLGRYQFAYLNQTSGKVQVGTVKSLGGVF